MARKLLMEGIIEDADNPSTEGCIMYPEVSYVRQPVFEGEGDDRKQSGERVYFFSGKDNQLNESLIEEGVTLCEDYEQLDLTERTMADGRKVKLPTGTIFVEGPYQRSDVKNANKRTYGRKIWERIVGDGKSPAQQSVKERRMIGHVEHPKDGRTDGKEGALLHTHMKLQEDGVVWGKSELLDTPNGLILQEYTRKGVKWGVSSRGQGSVGADGAVNEKDFNLTTFDAVMNPSTPGAYPTLSKKVNDDTSESTESEDTPDEAGGTTVDEAVLESEVAELRELDLTTLDESERANTAQRLVVQLGVLNGLPSSTSLSKEKVDELQNWLSTRLAETLALPEPDFDDVLDEAVESATTDDNLSTDQVIESVQARLSDALSEAEELRESMQVYQVELDEMTNELQETRQQLEESQTVRVELENRVSLLESLLGDAHEAEVQQGIQEAITEAIADLPRLAEYRDVLSNADDAKGVREIAERLVKDIAGEIQEEAASRSSSFVPPTPRLPTGLVVESQDDVAKPSKGRNLSEGARLVGAVLKKTTAKT